MKRGGYRPGAGRKPMKAKPNETGPNVGPDALPLDYMLAVIRDPNADAARRDRLAVAAAPFCHERIADDKIGKKQLRARAAETAGSGTAWAELLAPRNGTPS